jgi:hypothetical protein
MSLWKVGEVRPEGRLSLMHREVGAPMLADRLTQGSMRT